MLTCVKPPLITTKQILVLSSENRVRTRTSCRILTQFYSVFFLAHIPTHEACITCNTSNRSPRAQNLRPHAREHMLRVVFLVAQCPVNFNITRIGHQQTHMQMHLHRYKRAYNIDYHVHHANMRARTSGDRVVQVPMRSPPGHAGQIYGGHSPYRA